MKDRATIVAVGFETGGSASHAFFQPFAVTFDFLDMRLFLSGSSPSYGSGR